jgi:hypothetical protein
MGFRTTATIAGALLCAGCAGLIGDGDGEGDGAHPQDEPFGCSDGSGPSISPLRRISHVAYLKTLRDLIARATSPADAEAVLAALELELSLLPGDNGSASSVHQDYDRLDQTSSQSHADAYYEIAVAAARELTRSEARLELLAGGCATDADGENDAACVRTLVERLALLALRRPPSIQEVEFYSEDATGSASDVSAQAFAERIAVLLQAPQFVFHLEDGEEAIDDEGALFPLSPYELAARLSYHFWNTMPDEALLSAAESGALATDDGYSAEVERLFADPRTRASIDDFFRAWLWLGELVPLDAALGDPAYDDFVGDAAPSAELSDAVAEDALDLLRHYTWSESGNLADVLVSELSFAKSEELAAIYGVPPWREGEAPPRMPSGERSGLLTRAAMLVTGTVKTRPIIKGLWILERLLCNGLPPPPPDAEMTELVEVPPDVTVRERIELLTLQPGSECVTCHAVLNPYGFATESYDALGRYRSEERVYDEVGNLIATLPVDDSSEHGNGGIELSRNLAARPEPSACLATNYFRFTFGRREDRSEDGCVLGALNDALEEGSLADMLRAVALHPSFRLRRRGDSQ